MGYIQANSCPQCGAPIYVESPWWSTMPPPTHRTCPCFGVSDGQKLASSISMSASSSLVVPIGGSKQARSNHVHDNGSDEWE